MVDRLVVQKKVVDLGPSMDSATAAFDSNVTAGNTIVVVVSGWRTSGSGGFLLPVGAVTDSLLNTYAVAINSLQVDAGVIIQYAYSITGGACTITINPTGTSNDCQCVIYELVGYGGRNPLDGTSSNGANTGSVISTTETNNTTTSGVAFAACSSTGVSTLTTSGWVNDKKGATGGVREDMVIDHLELFAGRPIQGAWKGSGSSRWTAAIASFKCNPIVGIPSPDLRDVTGPVGVYCNGQIVENIRITSLNNIGILADGYDDVIVRTVQTVVGGSGNYGVYINGARPFVADLDIVISDAPSAGALPDAGAIGLWFGGGSNAVVTRLRGRNTSSLIYASAVAGIQLSQIEGHDMRGPFPRGQLVQFDACTGTVILDGFSCENDPNISWPEDNISVYRTSNATIRRGFIDGNNSTHGVGVMFELDNSVVGASGGLCEDVDVIHMGDGSFSGSDAVSVIFRRCNTKDNHITSQGGRDAPIGANGGSDALIFAGINSSSLLELRQCKYFNAVNPSNILFTGAAFAATDYTEADFTPRAPLRLIFPWEQNNFIPF